MIYPEHIELSLQDYPSQNEYWDPYVYVYPVAAYKALDPYTGEVMDSLANLLAQRPADVDSLPLIPGVNAAQIFHAQLAYLDFQNGSGVRYLTQYAQMFTPITNDGLFYVFQGLTSGGEYYVSVVLPVTAPFLQDKYDSLLPEGGIQAPPFDDPNIETTMQEYLRAISERISATPPEVFSPDLRLLDSLVSSIRIETP
jgi:hypothetical protein